MPFPIINNVTKGSISVQRSLVTLHVSNIVRLDLYATDPCDAAANSRNENPDFCRLK